MPPGDQDLYGDHFDENLNIKDDEALDSNKLEDPIMAHRAAAKREGD